MINFLTSWIDNLFYSIDNEDTSLLYNLIDPQSPSEEFEKIFPNITQPSQYNSTITNQLRNNIKEEKLYKNFNEFITNYFQYRINSHQNEFSSAFENLKDSFINFSDIHIFRMPKISESHFKIFHEKFIFPKQPSGPNKFEE